MNPTERAGALQRTALAWERSAIGSLAVAALVLRQGIIAGPLLLALPIVALLVAVAALEWLIGTTGGSAPPAALRAVAAVTLVAAAGAAALAITG